MFSLYGICYTLVDVIVNGENMLTIKKRGTDNKTYAYGLAAMAVCSAGAITAMALGGSLSGQVASVSPTKKAVASKTTSAEPSAKPSSDVESEATQSSTYSGSNMNTSTPESSSASQPDTSSTPSPTPTPSETPTPTPTPTPSPEPTPTPPIDVDPPAGTTE